MLLVLRPWRNYHSLLLVWEGLWALHDKLIVGTKAKHGVSQPLRSRSCHEWVWRSDRRTEIISNTNAIFGLFVNATFWQIRIPILLAKVCTLDELSVDKSINCLQDLWMLYFVRFEGSPKVLINVFDAQSERLSWSFLRALQEDI